MVEAVPIDRDGNGVHSISHVLRVTDLIRGAAHGGNVDVVVIAGVVVTAFDTEMGHGNGPVCALKSATTIMNLHITGALLIRIRATATSFHEVGVLFGGIASGVCHAVCEGNWTEVGNVVGASVKALSVGCLSESVVPDSVCERGKFAPSVGSVVKAVTAGSNREIIIPNVVVGSGNGTPSVLARKRLSGFVPRKFDPSVLTGESASGMIPGGKAGNGKACSGSCSRRGWLLACGCRLRGSNQRRRWRSLRVRFRHGQVREEGVKGGEKRAKVRANMAVLQIVRAVDMMPLGAGVDRNGRKRDMCTGATRAGVEDVGLWTWKGERWGLSDRGGE